MTKKSRAVMAIVLTVLLLGIATLVWANQTGKINIFGDTTSPQFKCASDGVMVGLYQQSSLWCVNVNSNPGSNILLDNQTVSNEAPLNGWNNTSLICPGTKFANGIASYIASAAPAVAKQLYCVDLKSNNSVMARGETKKVILTQQAFQDGAMIQCGPDYYMYGIEIQNYPSYPLKEMAALCAKAVPTNQNQTGTITLTGVAQCDKSGANPANALSWGSNPGSNGYTLLRDGVSIADMGADSIGRIDSSMGSGTHTYQLTAKSGSATSNVVSLTTATCTSSQTNPGSEYSFTMTKNSCEASGQVSEFTTTVPSNLYNMIDVRLTHDNVGVGQDEKKQSYSIAWKQFLDPGDTRFNQVYFDLMYGNGFTDPNIKWASPVAANGATVGQISGLPSGADHQALIVPKLNCPVTPTPTPDTQVPTVPTLTATAQGQNNINLSWTASTDNVGVTGYDVYNADNNQFINSTPNTSYAVTGATCATEYKYYVIAHDAAGNSSPKSNIASATTGACGSPDAEKPTKPTNVVASSISCHNIGLSWTKSTDNVGVTGYDIYNAGNDKLITTSNDNYEFSGLTENTDYSYYLIAHDAAGNSSDKSDTVSTKSPTCPKTTESTTKVSSLVSTGGVLWFNILIALIIAGIASYLLLRQKEER